MPRPHPSTAPSPATSGRLAVVLRVLVLVVVACPGRASAWGDEPRVIPPGREAEIQSLVQRALGSTDLGSPSLRIERDRIRIDPGGSSGPRFVLMQRDSDDPDEPGEALASGVVVSCGPAGAPRDCTPDERETWRAAASALARERDVLAATLWVPEAGRDEPRDEAHVAPAPPRTHRRIDEAALLLVLALSFGFAVRACRGSRVDVHAYEWAFVFASLALFVALTTTATSLLPLHEHASFVARADCAVDPRCVTDPIGAWSPTSFHVLGVLLRALPYRVEVLSWVSLGFAVVYMLLAWGLTRRLLIELERPRLAPYGASATLLLLTTHPVHWRLAGSGSFWPYALVCVLGATWVGLEARRARTPLPAALGWLLAALLLAFACGGNMVLLTLAPLSLLGPLCWIRGERPRLASIGRAVAVGAPSLAACALVGSDDLADAVRRVFGEGRAGSSYYGWFHFLRHYDALLLDLSVSPPVWTVPLLVAPAWAFARLRARAPDPRPSMDAPARSLPPTGASSSVLPPSRLLFPVVYAVAVPHLFLGVAAGELVGPGYPVGFLNHHWEFVFASIAVGVGAAWLVGAAQVRFPWFRASRRAWALPAMLGALGLLLAPLPREGWRMARGVWVVERELEALQTAFDALPPHDLLVVAPRLIAPLPGIPLEGDPLEVNFPAGAYAFAMRARGLTPAEIVDTEQFAERTQRSGGDARILLYVGSSLRAFQPQEIRVGAVPSSLERPELTRLRASWETRLVHEFELPAAQHEAISLRLGADRTETVRVGFYALRSRVAR